MIDFVRLKKDSDLDIKKRKMPDKQEPEEPPPPPDLSMALSNKPSQEMGDMAFAIDVDVDVGGANFAIAASDTDVVPIVRVNPQYPLRASERGIEGWVEVDLPSASWEPSRIRGCSIHIPAPSSIARPSRRFEKWKYNPKIEDGEPVERPGVKVRLKFELSNQLEWLAECFRVKSHALNEFFSSSWRWSSRSA